MSERAPRDSAPADPGPPDVGPTAAATRDERIRRRSAERRSRRRVEVKRAILDASIELFRDRGYEGFSLRQVAEEVGYSATTIYNYFADKDDLLLHVAVEGLTRFGDSLQAAYDAGRTPLERFRGIARAYVEFGLDHPLHYRLMFLQRGEFLDREPPEDYPSVVDAFAVLERTVAECLASGDVAPGDPHALSLHAWAYVHGLVGLAIAVPKVGEEAVRAALEEGLERFFLGVAARPPEGG